MLVGPHSSDAMKTQTFYLKPCSKRLREKICFSPGGKGRELRDGV